MKKKLPAFLFFTFIIVSAVEKTDFIEKVDDGHINWTERTVVVTGSGVPELNIHNENSARLYSEKVAVKNAGYRLTKILGNISLDGNVTVSRFIEEKKDMTFEIPGSRAEPIEKSRRNYSDGAVDIKLSYSIKDSLHEVCARYREELQKKSVSTKVVRNLPVDEKILFPKLVVEVNKSKFSPVLFPRIVSDEGKMIYGLEKQSVNDPCGKPMMYVSKYKKKDSLYVKAKRIDKNKEIVLSQEDVFKVKTQLRDNVLKNGEVLIVLK